MMCAPEASNPQPSRPPPEGRILVVEDDAACRRGYGLILRAAGLDVVTASGGDEALDKAATQGPFDVVLSDVNMPEGDGFELTEKLRASSDMRDVPIILISALGHSRRRVRGLDMGADDFLEKPVDADELVARVRAHLRHAIRQQELLRQSHVDALTGLLNRRAIDAELDRELLRMARTGQPLSVLMLDLDDFKDVNDRYGHAAGDDALRRTADKLVSLLRNTDRVGRIGGDEMLAILPDTSREDAQALTERILLAWRRHPPMPSGTSAPVLVSIGTATADKPMARAALLEVADKRMYEAKRNRKRGRASAR